MSIIGSNILAGAAGSGVSAYEIEQSLRFNSADSAYLNRTPGSAGNRKTWTWSLWLKRAGLGATNMIWSCGGSNSAADTDYLEAAFNSSDQLIVATLNGQRLISTQRFRDASAWYHLVFKLDTTQSTVSDRLVVYLNGSEIAAWDTDTRSTYFAQNSDQGVGRTEPHLIGRQSYSGSDHTNIYLAEVNFIDGSALDPTDFGEFDDNGVWRPIQYAGSYTGNSFYLKFASGDGTDSSGLSNTWTANNFTTSGTGTDVMSDTPTNNFATVSPLNINVQNVLSDGNLTLNLNSSVAYKPTSTIAIPSSGKFYFEGTIQGGASQTAPDRAHYFGLNESFPPSSFLAKLIGWFSQGTKNIYTGSGSSSGASGSGFINGDVLQCAVDADTGKVWMGLNNTWYSTAANANGDPAGGTNESATMVAGTQYHSFTSLGLDSGVTGGYYINFGQRPFAYTPPTGFKTLSTKNLPAPDIADGSEYFDTLLWTGDGSSPRSISGLEFSPDFVWYKSRSNAYSHTVYDIVRGAGNDKTLLTNTTADEATAGGADYGYLSAFDSTGFTLTEGDINFAWGNASSATYAAWCWDAGGSGSSNTNGSITSTVSANATAGFSIVSYTGTGANATVGHGLGVAPQFFFGRNRDDTGGLLDWIVYHESVGNTGRLKLNTDGSTSTSSTFFQNTSPSSTVFSIGTSNDINKLNDDYIMYCFAEVESYSRIGSYVGNGSSDGPFIFCGFRPAYVWLKGSTFASNWNAYDSARDQYNITDDLLRLNSSAAEVSNYGATAGIDLLSNGFKIRTSSGDWNSSGQTFVFCAFAENPFGGSGVSPATAR